MPPMLLLPISLIRLRQFALALSTVRKRISSIDNLIRTANMNGQPIYNLEDFHIQSQWPSTSTSFRNINFQPCRCALTAMSISSTVVRSIHPPESSNALILQTPAVPLNPKKFKKTPFTCCSTSKWKQRLIYCNRVNRFSSLFTKDHLAWTSPSSSLSCKGPMDEFELES
jgi:hypothetical protein